MPAKRAYGMDQDFYPWSPIVTRPVLRWPDNARVALAVIVNLEHWDWEVPEGTPLSVSPIGEFEGLWSGNQPNFPDIGGEPTHGHAAARLIGILGPATGMSQDRWVKSGQSPSASPSRSDKVREYDSAMGERGERTVNMAAAVGTTPHQFSLLSGASRLVSSDVDGAGDTLKRIGKTLRSR